MAIVALCAVALRKGRMMLGIAGLVFPPLALLGVVRLARPSSPWARRRYPADGRHMRRATTRFERRTRRYRRWQEWIGGEPSAAPSRGPAGPVSPGEVGRQDLEADLTRPPQPASGASAVEARPRR